VADRGWPLMIRGAQTTRRTHGSTSARLAAERPRADGPAVDGFSSATLD